MDWAAVTVASNTSFHCLRCLFFNNSIHFPTAVTSGTKAGGALKISSSSTAYLTSSTFSNNTLSTSGKRSTGSYGSASYRSESLGGAAAGVDGGTTVAVFTHCTFLNNDLWLSSLTSEAGYGGALYVKAANVTLLHCRFSHNSISANGTFRDPSVYGGAVALGWVTTGTIRNCSFKGNLLTGHLSAAYGGGLSMVLSSGVHISGSRFVANKGSSDGYAYGGGLSVYDSDRINISTSTFHSNQLFKTSGNGNMYGVAVYAGNTNFLSLESCNFTRNYAVITAGTSLYGEAIYLDSSSGVIISSPVFNLNNGSSASNSYGRSLYMTFGSSASMTYAMYPTSSLSYAPTPYEIYIDTYSGANLTSCTMVNDAMTAAVRRLTLGLTD